MADMAAKRLVDLSHLIEHGMVTYGGLPGPQSAIIGRARARRRTMTTAPASRSAGSTWSPIPAPISTRPSIATKTAPTWPGSRWSSSPRCPASASVRKNRRPAPNCFEGLDVAGKAVLIHTGWDRHWRTDGLWQGPHLSRRGGGAPARRARRETGRHRQLQYRRHRPPHPPRSHRPARRERPDLRAYDQSRRAARRRLHLHRRTAEDRRHGHLPGPRLRPDRRLAGLICGSSARRSARRASPCALRRWRSGRLHSLRP